MSADTATLPRDCADTGGRAKIVLKAPLAGTVWCAGWMFTIGFAGLGFWKGVLAIVIWPYFLGALLG